MQGMGPAISGVRLSDRPILGPGLVSTGAGADAPGMLDRVKQLVGLGPSAVCFLLSSVYFVFLVCYTSTFMICMNSILSVGPALVPRDNI